MGVELADHIANHTRALLEPLARVEAQLAHGMQDAPMHGLEPITRIGQRPVHDGGQSIGEVALFQRGLQFDRLDGAIPGGVVREAMLPN